jgi:ParB-like chromosome segregation protein Spo0J
LAQKSGVEDVRVAQLDRRLAGLRLAPPEEVARLRSSVARDGIRAPLVVSTGVEPGVLVVIDGFKRLRILEEREIESAPAQLVALDVTAAQVAILHCNAPHRGLCDLEEAWIIRSLCRDHGLTQVTVAKLLRRDKSWVCRRLRLAEHLDPVIQEDIRLGLLSSAVAREMSRLPRGNQVPMARAIREHGLTSRQVAVMVSAVLGSDDPAMRRDLLSDPLRYVTAQIPAVGNATDPRLGVGGNEIRKALLLLDAGAGRVVRMLIRHAPAGLRTEAASVLAEPIAQALAGAEAAVSRLRQVAADSDVGLVRMNRDA